MGRVDWQPPAKGGTGPMMGGAEYSRRREGNRKNERHFFPGVTLHSHPIGWCLLRVGGSVGRNYRTVVSPQELGSACPGLKQPPC